MRGRDAGDGRPSRKPLRWFFSEKEAGRIVLCKSICSNPAPVDVCEVCVYKVGLKMCINMTRCLKCVHYYRSNIRLAAECFVYRRR